MTEKLKNLFDKDLYEECRVVAAVDEDKYEFSRKKFKFPWAKSDVKCEVKIIKCSVGFRFKVLLLSNGKKLGRYESDKVVSSITRY